MGSGTMENDSLENGLTLANRLLLESGHDVLQRLDDLTYARTYAFGCAVGGHIRHCLDFYQCFLDGIERGWVDYNRRERNGSIQECRSMAMESLQQTIAALGHLSALSAEMTLRVRPEDDESSGFVESWTHSSVARELQFLLSHTVHHFAVVAILLRLQGIEPCSSFGVAPSTLAHWRQTASWLQ